MRHRRRRLRSPSGMIASALAGGVTDYACCSGRLRRATAAAEMMATAGAVAQPAPALRSAIDDEDTDDLNRSVLAVIRVVAECCAPSRRCAQLQRARVLAGGGLRPYGPLGRRVQRGARVPHTLFDNDIRYAESCTAYK